MKKKTASEDTFKTLNDIMQNDRFIQLFCKKEALNHFDYCSVSEETTDVSSTSSRREAENQAETDGNLSFFLSADS